MSRSGSNRSTATSTGREAMQWRPQRSDVAAWARKAARPLAAIAATVAAMCVVARTPAALALVGLLFVARRALRRR
jgi:hypothetical protein